MENEKSAFLRFSYSELETLHLALAFYVVEGPGNLDAAKLSEKVVNAMNYLVFVEGKK